MITFIKEMIIKVKTLQVNTLIIFMEQHASFGNLFLIENIVYVFWV